MNFATAQHTGSCVAESKGKVPLMNYSVTNSMAVLYLCEPDRCIYSLKNVHSTINVKCI